MATHTEAAAGNWGEKAHTQKYANIHDLLGRQTTAIKSKSTLYFKHSMGTGTEIIS